MKVWLLAKLYKEKEDLPTYVLGKDVNMEKVANLSIISLIGDWEYIHMNIDEMVCWVSNHCRDSLDSFLDTRLLVKGLSMAFTF